MVRLVAATPAMTVTNGSRYHSDNHGQAVRTSAGHDDVYPRVRLTTLCHRSVLQPVNNTLLEQPRRTGRASSHRAQPALCTSDRLEPLRIACHPRDSPGTDPPSPRCIFPSRRCLPRAARVVPWRL